MSALNLLKNALNQTKNQKQELKQALDNNSNNNNNNSKQKWVRKGELEQVRERQYFEKQGIKRKQESEQQQNYNNNNDNGKEEELVKSNNNTSMESSSESTTFKKLKTTTTNPSTNTTASSSSNGNSNNLSTTQLDNDDDDDDNSLESIPRFEVFRLLRSYGEPITLFGESDEFRWKRLKNIQTTMGEFIGQQNDFAKALKEREQEVVQVAMVGGEQNTSESSSSRSKKDIVKYIGVIPKKQDEDSYNFVLRVLKRLMKEWRYKLDDLPEHVKKSAKGKHDATIYKQTKSYIKPLFKLLKKRQLADEIVQSLEPICFFMSEKEYVKANDVYMDLSIGNQPWPIGVTMVGIHARTARERIGSDKIKHILNDEDQRRYVQSVKRLMTLAQQLYPTVPSKMVE